MNKFAIALACACVSVATPALSQELSSRAGRALIDAEVAHISSIAEKRRALELAEYAASIAQAERERKDAERDPPEETTQQQTGLIDSTTFPPAFAPGPALIPGGDATGSSVDVADNDGVVTDLPAPIMEPVPQYIGTINGRHAVRHLGSVFYVGVGMKVGDYTVRNISGDTIHFTNGRGERVPARIRF